MNIYLFSYGTLQLEKVQLESFGRILKGKKDKLFSYKLENIEITDEEVLRKSNKKFHPIAVKSNNKNDFISGVLFEITSEELQKADEYEVSDYQRVNEIFQSGTHGWVYIKK